MHRKIHNLLPEKRYSHKVRSQDGVDMIITMLPSLAALIHMADLTLLITHISKCMGSGKKGKLSSGISG